MYQWCSALHSTFLTLSMQFRDPCETLQCQLYTLLYSQKKTSTALDMGFPGGSAVKNPSAMQGTQETVVRSLGWEGPLEEDMATHSSILAWRIP